MFSFGEFKQEDQDKMLAALNRKVAEVYGACIGQNEANIRYALTVLFTVVIIMVIYIDIYKPCVYIYLWSYIMKHAINDLNESMRWMGDSFSADCLLYVAV